jgi:peptidoglycan hydrolase-like protein with peptidoglycan-binding domain
MNMKIKYLSALPIIAVLIFSCISSAHAQVFTGNLYYGLQNNGQVTQLQKFLNSQGFYSGPITGNFYSLTLDAVKAFQAQEGITPAAGYFGPVTMDAANKIADAGTSTSSIPPALSTPQAQLQVLLQEVASLQKQLQVQQSDIQNLQTQASALPPTVRITANGSTGQISIPMGTSATISWSSTNATSCNVSGWNIAGWSGISGSESTGNLIVPRTYFKFAPWVEYTVTCSGPTGSVGSAVDIYLLGSASTTSTASQ